MQQITPNADVLIVTPHIEPPLLELRRLLGGDNRVDIFCSNPVAVWGDRRGLAARVQYFWIDPIVTMIKLARFVSRYRIIITYYHRNGYWLGMVRRCGAGQADSRWIWIGFAPNPPGKGLRGRLREFLTRNALIGFDLIVCNTRPVIDMIKQRYQEVQNRLAFARWGGGLGVPRAADIQDEGYIFCGGRTNRDFDTVLRAATDLHWPAVFVVGQEVQFSGPIPDFISIHRDVSPELFQRFIERARVVVLALKCPDISSGQVVLMQSMRCSKPIVVTATAGIEDYVTDGRDAILVAPESIEDLKLKLTPLLTNETRRQELAKAARATYEQNFNSTTFARAIFDILSVKGWTEGAESPSR